MKDKFDDLIEKFRQNTEKMKELTNRLEEQNQRLYYLAIELNILGNKIKNRKLGQEEILN